MVGKTFYPPADVIRVILGDDVPGASFTVGWLRFPAPYLPWSRESVSAWGA